MTTYWKCNNHGCETECWSEYDEQWVKVSIDLAGTTYVSHYCPECWLKLLTRKAIAIHDIKEKKS